MRVFSTAEPPRATPGALCNRGGVGGTGAAANGLGGAMAGLTRGSLAYPWATLLGVALATALLGAGALRLQTDVGYRSLLGAGHPAVSQLDAFLEHFDSGLPLLAVYDCGETTACQSALDPEALRMAAAVAAALRGNPALRRVDTPATTPLRVPGDDAPRARTLVEDGAPAPDLAWLADRVLHDSLWPRWLVSETGTVGAIALEVTSSRGEDSVAAYAALEAALAAHEAAGYRFHRVGGPVEFVVAGRELEADVARLVPFMIALIALVLLAVFRSPALTAAALASVGAAALWAFGLLGWLGWSQNTVSQALPPLLLVIGICDVIHVLARYASEAADHPQRPAPALLVDVARDTGPACVATSITTAAGFLSFSASGLESFVRFGVVAAFGVLVALGLTFTLLPVLVVRARPDGVRARRASQAWDRVLRRATALSETRWRAILALALVAALPFGIGFARLRVDASFEDLYGEDSPVVRWARTVGDTLRRPDSLEVELVAPEAAPPAQPETLAVVERTAASLAGIEGLGPARSIVDLLALGHQLANEDEPFWRRLPGREADVREILDQVAADDRRAVTSWVDLDARRFRISLEAEKPPQEEMRRIFREVDAVLAGLPAGWSHRQSGPLEVVHRMVEEIQRTQLESFGLAAAVIFALVAAFLRSLRWALLALVPTVLPVVATLGAMGLAGASLDVGSAMVAAIVLGIAVDDAIHLLARYRVGLGRGLPPSRAMSRAVHHVGRAVVTTSLALMLGFFTLTASSWKTIASFGALSAIAILGALAATLLVLPALVRATARH